MRRLRVLGILLALALVTAPASASTRKGTGRDDVTRHDFGRVAAALREDGLNIERTGRLYAGVCPQLRCRNVS